MSKRRFVAVASAVVVSMAVAIAGVGYAFWSRPDALPAYRCDRLHDPSKVDACMNHAFPAREQILAHLNDATFQPSQTGTRYSLRYFSRDGRYVTLSVGGASVPWGVAFIDSGRWWLHEARLPLRNGRETRDVRVQQICSLEYTWTNTHRDIKDEDPDVSCATLWDLNADAFQDDPGPQVRLGGDAYRLLDLYRLADHQFRMQDFSSVASGAEVSPDELQRAARRYRSEHVPADAGQ